MAKSIANANPVSKTGRAILEALEANPQGLSRYKIVVLIPEFADESVRRMVSTLKVRGYIQPHVDENGVVRFTITDEGRAKLHEAKPAKQRQIPPDGWVAGPWVHPIRAKLSGKIPAYHSTVTAYDPPPDPTTQKRPYYPPTRRNGSDSL